MEKLLQINFAVLVLYLFCLPAIAQSNAEIEEDLVAAIGEVQKYSNYGDNYDGEKLSKANEIFRDKLLKYTKTAATLNYKFGELDKLMLNATAEDGKFRIYTWDTEDGGTMHNYSRVYQFMGADGKVYSQTEEVSDEEEDSGAGSFVYDIFAVDAKGGKFYIVCTNFIGSTNDHYQSANLFKIEGGKLNDKVNLIKTKSGLTNSLGFEYNFFSVADRPEHPIKLISFDRKTKTLKIPVVIETEKYPNGEVTNRFISYRFNGANFVKIN